METHFQNKDELKSYITELIIESHWGDISDFDIEEIATYIFIYYDIKNIVTKLDIDHQLLPLVDLTPRDLAIKLNELNSQFESMRFVHWIIQKEDQDKTIRKLSEISFLSEEEIHRLKKVVKIYKFALEKIGDSAKIVCAELSDETLLRCVTSSVTKEYIKLMTKTKRWLNPIEAIVSTRKIEDLESYDLLIPSNVLNIFTDEDHYKKAIHKFESAEEYYLADIARVFLYYGKFLKQTVDGDINTINFSEVEEVFERLDTFPLSQPEIFEDFRDAAFLIPGMLRLLLTLSPDMSPTNKRKHLEKAEICFDQSSEVNFRSLCPMIMWIRAQLLDGYEQERLEIEAIEKINRLLAASAMENDPIKRLTAMTTLVQMPANWKFAKGDFKGAIDAAITSNSLAEAAVTAIKKNLESAIHEIQKEINDPHTSEEEKEQLLALKQTFISIVESAYMMKRGSDLLIILCKAKLAELNGNFVQASFFYDEAWGFEKQMVDDLIKFLSIFIGVLSPAKMFQYGLQNEARAAYFQGMAALNKGDHFLMESDFSSANQNYTEAKNSFGASHDLWMQEANRLEEIHQNDAKNKALQEANLNTLRLRYCDVKISISMSEQYSLLGRYLDSAKVFDKAAGIFRELIEEFVGNQENRNLEILKASEDYCKGRSLFEIDKDMKAQNNFEEAQEFLTSAAIRFEKCGEVKWSQFIDGLNLEYQATIYYMISRLNNTKDVALYSQLSQSKANEAKNIYKRLGLEQRVKDIERWIIKSSNTVKLLAIPLPNPFAHNVDTQDSMNDILKNYGFLKKEENPMEHEYRSLQAKAISLANRLKDLEERRNQGKLDESRYQDLARGYDEERLEVLFQIQEVLQGKDDDLDKVIQSAISGETDLILKQQLSKIVKKKGLNDKVIEQLNEHKGTIISWILEIGFQIAKRVNEY